MLFILSGGGTAGHINPALALAEELQARNHQVLFAGTPQGIEGVLVRDAGIEFHSFEASGFNRNHPASFFTAVSKTLSSTKKAGKWFDGVKPDCVVCFGGYVTMSLGRAAIKRNIPLVIHEQNSVMGLANKYLAKQATSIALTYKCSGNAIKQKGKIAITGNPVRKAVFAATRKAGRKYLGVPENALMLLVFGGSLGARHLNNAIVGLKDSLLAEKNLFVVQISGPNEYETVREALALSPQAEKRWLLFAYQNRMGDVLAAADVVVSRAGATSLAEISARRLPALLIPFPFATEDHQTTNAQAFVSEGAAFMVADDALEGESFRENLFRMLREGDLRQQMSDAQARFKTESASSLLADVVIDAAQAANNRYNSSS